MKQKVEKEEEEKLGSYLCNLIRPIRVVLCWLSMYRQIGKSKEMKDMCQFVFVSSIYNKATFMYNRSGKDTCAYV